MRSIVTNYLDVCLICGKPREALHHLIMGVANRQKSDNAGLIIPLCNDCHNLTNNSVHGNTKLNIMSKIIGQLAYERELAFEGKTKDEARELFRKEFGRSYI